MSDTLDRASGRHPARAWCAVAASQPVPAGPRPVIIYDDRPMAERQGTQATEPRVEAGKTWNSPEVIARHRAMTPMQRWRKTVQLSQAAQRLARTERIDGR